jgi:hypothetical protein
VSVFREKHLYRPYLESALEMIQIQNRLEGESLKGREEIVKV